MRSTPLIVAVASLLAMSAAIGYGIVAGDFGSEGSQLIDLAWGRVTLVDLYVGLFMFGAWIALRERSPARIAAWWIGLILLGNLAAAGYLAHAAIRNSGNRIGLLTGDGTDGTQGNRRSG